MWGHPGSTVAVVALTLAADHRAGPLVAVVVPVPGHVNLHHGSVRSTQQCVDACYYACYSPQLTKFITTG